MYILSDRFLGNIINTKYSYLMGNKFYYTNDGINYSKMEIDKKDIYEGTLDKFYTYINIYPWIEEDILSEVEHMIDSETNCIYLEVYISNDNEIKSIYAVKKSEIDSNRLIEAFEVVSPVKNKAVMMYSKDTGCILGEKGDFFKNASIAYTANICFPNMIYREDVDGYVFKNKTLFTYKSKENVINSLDDFISMKEMGR